VTTERDQIAGVLRAVALRVERNDHPLFGTRSRRRLSTMSSDALHRLENILEELGSLSENEREGRLEGEPSAYDDNYHSHAHHGHGLAAWSHHHNEEEA
jgi:hypothetical protein